MKKLKAFFYVLTKSILDPSWYKEMLATPTSFTIKYFFAFGLFLTLLTAIGLTVYTPQINKGLDDLLVQARNVYPGDFTFEVKDGEWFINRPEPFAIPFPKDIDSQDLPDNFMVFYKNGTINDLKELSTMILINDTNVIVQNSSRGKIEAYSLDGMTDGKFDRGSYMMLIDKMAEFKGYVAPTLIVLGSIGIFFANTVFRLFSLIMLAFFVWIVARALNYQNRNNKYTNDFGSAYRVTMHAATLPAIVGLLVSGISLLGVPVTALDVFMLYFPAVYTIAFSVFAISKTRE